MSIRNDGQAYRRGVVFGFTVAEVVLLLVFCLLLLFMPILLSKAAKQTLSAPPTNSPAPIRLGNKNGGSTSPASQASSNVSPPAKDQPPGDEAKAPLPPDWQELVPNGAGSDYERGVNGTSQATLRPPTSKPMPGLTIDAVCKKLGIPEGKCTVINADAQLHNAGRHNWPPIIPLSEADGYYFVSGSAEANTRARLIAVATSAKLLRWLPVNVALNSTRRL